MATATATPAASTTELEALARAAVRAMLARPDADDAALAAELEAAGATPGLADRLVVLVPTAFARAILGPAGARFSDTLRVRGPHGDAGATSVAGDPVYQAAQTLTARFAEEFDGDVVRVAGRAPEFKAINDALNDGAAIEAIVLSDLVAFVRD